jgi:hypothetical protein
VNEDAIADARIGQPIGLIEPAANGARGAAYRGGERLEVGVVGEKPVRIVVVISRATIALTPGSAARFWRR